MTDKILMQELARLQAQSTSAEDWRDLYETLEAYQRRCLARAIVNSTQRDVLVAEIRRRAEV